MMNDNSRIIHFIRKITLLSFFGGLFFLASSSNLFARKKSRWKTTDSSMARNLRAAMRPRFIALVVGIEQYQDRYWQGLRYAASDAKKFGRFLRKYGHFDRVFSLTHRKQTTTQHIKDALKNLRKQNTSPLDTVVIYISGHGTISRPSEGRNKRYVITSDTSTNIPATALSVDWIRKALQTFSSRHKMLMLATCYSGDPRSKSRRPRGHKGKLIIPTFEYSRVMLILSASSRGEPAFESDKLKGDVYTHFFLQCIKTQYTALQSCLKSTTKRCHFASATQVHTCAVRKTLPYVRRHFGQHQLPSLESQLDGFSAITLINKKRPVRLHERKVASARKSVLQIFPNLLQRFRIRLALKGRKGASNPLKLNHEIHFLQPGLYEVRLFSRKHKLLSTFSLNLRTGQRMTFTLPPHLLRPKKAKREPLPQSIQVKLFVKDPGAPDGLRDTGELAQLCHWIESKLRAHRDFDQKNFTLKWRKMFPHITRRINVWGVTQKWARFILKESRKKKQLKRWFHPTAIAYFAYWRLKFSDRKKVENRLIEYQKKGMLGQDKQRMDYEIPYSYHRHWLRLRKKRKAGTP